MRYLKQKANETSSCAQDAHQKKIPRNDDLLYYTEFPNKTRNARNIAMDGGNLGIKINNVICYANAIFQIIASCNHLNEFLLKPPRAEHQRFSLYYEFACVISAMVSVDAVEGVNSQKFMDVFMDICPQFYENKRTYCVVVSTNELSYIHISILLIYFLFFQTSECWDSDRFCLDSYWFGADSFLIWKIRIWKIRDILFKDLFFFLKSFAPRRSFV
jgi:hypothetical protein